MVPIGSGYCGRHRKERRRQKERYRDNARERGYDAQWDKVSKMYRQDHPLCEKCGVSLSQEVDHIVPLSKGGAKYDHDNLQALCKPCHTAKTLKDQHE